MSRRSQVKGRGFCGIGIERTKTIQNIGMLWRSAVCLGADFLFTIGARYHRDITDTLKSWRHVPLFNFTDFADFNAHRPMDAQLIGVELIPGATSLEYFTHPERAVYLLGPEDGSLSPTALSHCQSVIRFQSAYCLNVAAAGSVVLYDRQAKLLRAGNGIG